MHSKLVDHLRKYTTFDHAEDSEILSYFEYKSYIKKEIIQEEGAPCMHHFFVLEGCLRQFFLSEKGVQHTTQFAIENWWITDYMAFATQSPAAFSLQAVEPTQVLCISQQNQKNCFLTILRWSAILGASINRLMPLYSYAPDISMSYQERIFTIISMIDSLILPSASLNKCSLPI